jgi:hypothetical protein
MADSDLPPESSESSYEVGYGKPPKHSQFKAKNKLGGRRPGSRNMTSLVREVAEDKVPVKINGKTRKVASIELSMRQLAKKANSGDLKAISRFVALYERYGPPEDDGPIPEEDIAHDLETLRHYFMMRGDIDYE